MSNYSQDITFIRTNQVALGDPRLAKQVKALVDYGYNVTILAWDRELEQKPLEILEGALVKNFRLKAPYGKLRIVFYYPIFWIWVLLNTLLMRPYVIHACNLDAGVIGYFCRKINLCRKFVFDIFDGFALSFIPHDKKVLFRLVHTIEDHLFYEADIGIIPSEERAKFYKRYGRKNVIVILNSPPDVVAGFKKISGNRRFTVVYAGIIGPSRGILELAKATSDLEVDLILAGRVINTYMFSKCNKYEHVKYTGLLSYMDALNLENIADCIVALYEPSTITRRLAEPSKVYEAIMLGKPLVTNVKRGVVEGYRCGITVSYGDIDELRSAIKFLKENPNVASEMGLNGRKAYEDCFNWSKQCEKLINAYRCLLNGA